MSKPTCGSRPGPTQTELLPGCIKTRHYKNTPMQYTVKLKPVKLTNFSAKKKEDVFLIFAQNIDCGYTLVF